MESPDLLGYISCFDVTKLGGVPECFAYPSIQVEQAAELGEVMYVIAEPFYG